MWNRQAANATRTSHMTLPSVYSREDASPTSIISPRTEEDLLDSDEKIRNDFLRKQPVMLEIMGAPHSSL
ncbi:unnamed protein product, partial [Rotaria socialis]